MLLCVAICVGVVDFVVVITSFVCCRYVYVAVFFMFTILSCVVLIMLSSLSLLFMFVLLFMLVCFG